MRSLLLALLLVTTTTLLAQNPANFQPVLVPVYDGGPGAFASQWTTRFSIYNNSDGYVEFARAVYIYVCGIPEGCIAAVPPRGAIYWPEPTEHIYGSAGSVIWEPKSRSADLFYSLRVYDTSRKDVTLGTALPVPRGSQFRDTELVLVDVPNDPRYRVSLRIYSLTVDKPVDVRVRVYKQAPPEPASPPTPGTIASERTLRLESPLTFASDPFPGRPSFARVDDPVGGLKDLPASLQIGVASLTPGASLWALVTVTNNATQQVTAIAPSP